jgi:hypothetical protein
MSGLITSSFGASVPDSDFLWSVKRTDNGYEARRFGRYKHLKPKVPLLVVFGEGDVTVTLAGLWYIHEFVGNTVLPTLAGLAQQSN